MKKSKLLELIKDIPEDEEIYFHPDSEMFIDDGVVCFGDAYDHDLIKETYYLYDKGYYDGHWLNIDSMMDEYNDLLYDEDREFKENEFKEFLEKYEKLQGYFIGVKIT